MCLVPFTFLQVLVILIISTVFGIPSREPESPCPEVFLYEKMKIRKDWIFPSNYNLKWRGIVTIPPSPPPIVLRIQLAIPNTLPLRFPGKIELAEKRDIVLRKISYGSKEKIKYNLSFPSALIPTVKLIEVNSEILCSSEPVLSNFTLIVTMEHTLTIPDNVFGRIKNLGNRGFLRDRSDNKVLEFSGESCGMTSVTSENPLAHASVAGKGNSPWIVPLFKKTESGLQFFCSATLITRELIVTAAHCIKDAPVDKSEIIADVGRFNIHDWTEEHRQPRNIAEVFIHPDYISETKYSDLAVLKFNKKIELTPYVNPVCLWSGDEDLDAVVGYTGVVSGWGMDALGNKISATPSLVTMPIVSDADCLRSKVNFYYLTSNRTFCAGHRNGTGPCNGDSGGGLLLRQRRNDGLIRWYLRGIVSLSLLDDRLMCNSYEYYVFTDVAMFRDWILGLIL